MQSERRRQPLALCQLTGGSVWTLKGCQYSTILCRNVPAVLFDPSVKCSLYEYLLKETILVFTNMGVKMFLCKTIMVRMYLIVFCLRYVQSLIVRVLYRMSFLMIIFGQNIPYIQLFLGSFCTQLKFINIFIFDVDFGIRGILYIFLCKDLIVIMILHLVHFGIFCLRPIEMWDILYQGVIKQGCNVEDHD